MTVLQLIAVFACLACILSKWIFALKQSRMEHVLDIERTNYKKVRNELNQITQKHKALVHTQKQTQAKSVTSQRNIGRLNQTKNVLVNQVGKEEELKTRQKEMISQLQKLG
ncbi:MAG: lipopolysaccharide export LptBFGC system permease protein LptF [Candidatus Latescibacterota bacterium]|jgi:lipopolysaccharide export LptBFGC system permease protein LptF